MTQTIGTQPFDPGIALLYASEYDAAYKASLSPSRLAYMALPYGPGDANYVSGKPSRTDPATIAQAAAEGDLDTQIQVWGWDATMTMAVRISQGYAWVPSWGQPSIPVGPGISPALVAAAGVQAYDPTNPPPGSIIMPKWDTTGALILPAPYVSPIPVPPPVPVAMQVGPYEFSGINPLDNTFGYYFGVVGGTNPHVGDVVEYNSQLFKLINYPSQSMFGNGTMQKFWKFIVP